MQIVLGNLKSFNSQKREKNFAVMRSYATLFGTAGTPYLMVIARQSFSGPGLKKVKFTT
jgi:hypothetical protein